MAFAVDDRLPGRHFVLWCAVGVETSLCPWNPHSSCIKHAMPYAMHHQRNVIRAAVPPNPDLVSQKIEAKQMNP